MQKMPWRWCGVRIADGTDMLVVQLELWMIAMHHKTMTIAVLANAKAVVNDD
jgi:hypothetical protein